MLAGSVMAGAGGSTCARAAATERCQAAARSAAPRSRVVASPVVDRMLDDRMAVSLCCMLREPADAEPAIAVRGSVAPRANRNPAAPVPPDPTTLACRYVMPAGAP